MGKQTKTAAEPVAWNFDKGLPGGFVIYKPFQQDAYKPEVIDELERGGKLLITRKRDGWKVLIHKANGRVTFYTDGINVIEGRLDHLKPELEKLLPDRTLLAGEAIVDVDDSDKFTAVGRIMQSSNWNDVQTEVGQLKLMLFEIVFWNGRYFLNQPYETRYGKLLLATALTELTRAPLSEQIIVAPLLHMSFAKAQKHARKNGWEGLVLYSADFTASFRVDGKSPARPKGCYKWKPLHEDDFIVRTWVKDPKDPKRLKEVVLTQLDPATGQEFYCGRLNAFTHEMREVLRKAKYPLVMQVVFEDRYESGKVRNARFERLRPDKKPSNCIAPKSFPSADRKKIAKYVG